TYSFEDRGGRRVTLRPEMTPSLARMVAAKRREMPFPLRWFSIGNRFRYERPQRGRLRDFYQTDVDFVGLPAGESDLEVVTLASDILKSFGATDADFAIRVNSRALLGAACRAVGLTDAEGVKAYWVLLDKKAKMSAEEFAAARGDKDPLKAIEDATDEAVRVEKEKIEAFIATLKERGIENVSFDPEIVRGFDYYTGMVFEINDTHEENPRALFGGGRYDGLVAMFGGDPIPAVGFAFGDVTFSDFLETHGLLPKIDTVPQVYIGTPEPTDAKAAQEFAATLRALGIRVFVNLSEKELGAQVKDAVKRGIPYFMAYGAQEAKSSMIRLKDLARSEEESIEENQIGKHLAKLLK
ncbi:MAG TPA: ATP phosphoribosyltransferase regulatory subunit, partial [Candidatus Paceibacterota bacterium]|nr:ATP phosphoribosyltransferase regulatory subunit [Candidatus Paceibacterota bacterium]